MEMITTKLIRSFVVLLLYAAVVTTASAQTAAPVPPPQYKTLGRVGPRTSPQGPPQSICESARQARARNSPAAAGLEAQCRAAGAAGETLPKTLVVTPSDTLFDKAKAPLANIYAEPQRSVPPTAVGTAIDKFGAGAVSDKAHGARPNPSKRLIISAEGSYGFAPVPSGKLYQGQNADGEIWLAISYEDGTPFAQARAGDIHIETLSSGVVARLDPSLSRANEGVWHFTLPQLGPGSHFYLVRVLVDVKAWRTTYEGRTIVRASYTRMPFWNAQRVDGTIWEPPK